MTLTRRCVAIAWRCSHSCERCSPESPSCHVSRAEHCLIRADLSRGDASRPRRRAPGARFDRVYDVLHAVDISLRDVLLCVCLFPLYQQRFALARVWARVILAVLRRTCRLDFHVEGSERLPSGNHIVLMKHSSSWETVAQAVLLPPQVWVLKRELTWIPFVGWGIRQLRAIAVDRGAGPAAVRSVLEQGKRRLAEGEWIVFFPEGTRMPPGQTRKYGGSGAMLAAETGKLIVPIAHDSGYYWPRRGLIKKPGTIQLLHRSADQRNGTQPPRRQCRSPGLDRGPLAAGGQELTGCSRQRADLVDRM